MPGVPTDPAAAAAAAARQMCAQMLDPTWTLPRGVRSSSGAQSPPRESSSPSAGPRSSQDPFARSVGSVGERATVARVVSVHANNLVGGAALAASSASSSAVRGARAWSPAPPLSVEPPRSPPPGTRFAAHTTVVGSEVAGPAIRRAEKRGTGPSAIPSSSTPTVLRRSPPRRPASPDEGGRRIVPLGHSASGGAASGSAASANGGSGPLMMSTGGTSYGSGNYGSGSYTAGITPKAKSPCRAAVVSVTASRASPPRNTTPRAWQSKQATQQAGLVQASQRSFVVAATSSGSGSSLATTATVGALEAGSATVPLGGIASAGGYASGGSLTVSTGGSLTAAAAIHPPSWPSPPRGASSPLPRVPPGAVSKAWHQQQMLAASATPTVTGIVSDGVARGATIGRTTSTSPARSGVIISSGAGQYWR
jgi:hypothetical protein